MGCLHPGTCWDQVRYPPNQVPGSSLRLSHVASRSTCWCNTSQVPCMPMRAQAKKKSGSKQGSDDIIYELYPEEEEKEAASESRGAQKKGSGRAALALIALVAGLAGAQGVGG